jgi:hypothetical protein
VSADTPSSPVQASRHTASRAARSSGRRCFAIDDVQHGAGAARLRFGVLLRRAFGSAAFAVEHVGARDVVLARAHQRQLDLVLDVLDVQHAAVGQAAGEGADHGIGESGHDVAHT